MKSSGLYIHVPFCRHKCLYCDFYSGGVRIADWHGYVDSLIHELSRRTETEKYILKPETVYIGGGTPSLMPLDHLRQLVEGIDRIINLSGCKEFTIEVNPENINKENCNGWKNIGINRVSLGVQSLNDVELKSIGRHHTSAEAVAAYNLLKNYFSNISVDLIMSLPGQTLKSYQENLDKIIDLAPNHVSVYSLTVEPGTALEVLADKGNVKLPDEDDWIKMNELTIQRLKEAGYLHYEISNYALPGCESIHNYGYWNGNPYMGIGPGAHSYDGYKTRRFNPKDLKGYVNWGRERENYDFFEIETLSEEELIEEFIMTRLRTIRGMDLEDFQTRFGKPLTIRLENQISELIRQGFLKKEGSRISLTESGIPLSDFIILRLVSAATGNY